MSGNALNTTITGNMPMFSGIESLMTPQALALINQSPTLVAQLNAYNNDVIATQNGNSMVDGQIFSLPNASGNYGIAPMSSDGSMSGNGAYTQTSANTSAVKFNLPGGTSDASFVGLLAKEMGQYVNGIGDYNAQQNLKEQLNSSSLTNDQKVEAYAGLINEQEAEGVANNYNVLGEMATPDILKPIGMSNGGDAMVALLNATAIAQPGNQQALINAAAFYNATLPLTDERTYEQQAVQSAAQALGINIGSLSENLLQGSAATLTILNGDNGFVIASKTSNSNGLGITTDAQNYSNGGFVNESIATVIGQNTTTALNNNANGVTNEVISTSSGITPVIDWNTSTITVSGAGIVSTSADAQFGVSGSNNSISMLSGNAFDVSGAGNQIACGSNSVTLSGSESASCFNGNISFSGNDVTGSVAAGSTVSVSGSGNRLALNNGSSASTISSGSNSVSCGDTVESVSGNASLSCANGNLTTTGTGNAVSASGTNLSINETGGTVTLADNAQGIVSGNGNDVNAGAGSTVDLQGAANTFSGGSNGTITVENTGSGIANADILNVSDSKVTIAGGAEAQVLGDDNVVGGLLGDGVLGVTGEADVTNGTVNLGTNTQATLSGTGVTVNAVDGDVVSEDNATINVAAGSTVTITGSGDTIVAGGNAQVTVTGGGDALSGQAGDTFILGGTGTNADSVTDSNATVVMGNNTQVSLVGGNDTVNEGAGDQLSISGTNGSFDTVDGTGATVNMSANTQVNLNGSSDSINESAGDSLGAYGGGNTVNTVAGALTVIGNTNNNIDTVNANGDAAGGTTANGQPTGIELNANSQVNVNGSSNTITNTGTNDTEGVYGGANTINTQAGDDVVIGGTNGNADAVYGNGDSSSSGANSWGTAGIYVNGNSQADIHGSSDGVNEAAGDSVGVYGASNIIDTTAGALTVIGDTNGGFDEIYANGDSFGGATANGQPTGIYMNGNSQADVHGANDGINESAGDSLGAYGGSDTIDTTGGALTYISGTNGSFDQVNANGDGLGGTTANGQPTGIHLDVNSQANVSGSNDGVSEASGDSLGIYGQSNTIDTTSDALTVIGDTNGGFDQVNANGDAFGGSTANGQGTGIYINGNSQANVDGRGDGVNLSAGDSVGVYGGGDTINAGAGDYLALGSTNGVADMVNATGDAGGAFTANGQGTGIGIGDNSQVYLNGSFDKLYEGSGDLVSVLGSYDTADGNATDTTDFFDDDTGDIDVGSGGGDEGGGDWDPGYDPEYDGDPIVLNLQGGKVQTQGLATSTASFDTQNDGRAVKTAWATADEGMLVYDPAHPDAPVTQDSQLVSGFDALKRLDSNGDGKLDASDAAWNDLRVWVDGTGTGQFETGSLHSLSQLGIASIDLNATQVIQNSNGNTILDDSTFTWTDGTKGDIAGVNLTFDGAPPPQSTQRVAATTQLDQLIQAMASFAPPPTAVQTGIAAANDQHLQAPLLAAAH